MNPRLGSHAMVIGSGIAGLCTARVLSRYFQEVTVLERGPQPQLDQPRKEAPQGYHLHALLKGGEQALEKLFPGIIQAMIKDGSIPINATNDMKWFHHGVWKKRFEGELSLLLQSRPFLESHIRVQVRQNPQIGIRYYVIAVQPIYDESQNMILGIQVKEGDSSEPIDLYADLIIDASGYGSMFHQWFDSHNYKCPEEKVNIDLCYVSQIYQLDVTRYRDWSILLVYPSAPTEKVGGAISCIERNRHIVTLFGYGSDLVQTDFREPSNFINYTKKLPQETIYNELQGSNPLSDTKVYKVPHIGRFRYEKTKDLPQRFLFIGDALCRFDPVFGQGMSVAAMEALALDNCLQREWDEHKRISTNFTNRFYKKTSKIIEPVWQMILIEDFRYRHVSGKKPIGLSFMQWYTKRIFHRSSQSIEIYNAFIYVMNLLRPATSLFAPHILYKTLWKK